MRTVERHHIIITGTGRAGTTFLVQLLTHAGLDTGFRAEETSRVDAISRAGLEWNILDEDAPYIVKSPHLSSRLNAVVESGNLVIDHAIVPMRDLYEAAESRRFVQTHQDRDPEPRVVRGGTWGTTELEGQEDFLARQTHALMHSLAVHDVPLTLLAFPRLAQDPDYLAERLHRVFTEVKPSRFVEAFETVARPELIHRFEPG